MTGISSKAAGYTLFELVLVLALLVVLSAMIYPSLEGMYGDYRVTAAADMIRAQWAAARAHAMDEGQPYRFAIVPDQGNFRLAPDGADFWSAGGGMPDANGSANPMLIAEDVLPRGVRLVLPKEFQENRFDETQDVALPVGSIEPGAWSTLVTFLPDGTAREDAPEIILQARGARTVSLRLRGLTGVVTTRVLASEGSR